MTDKPYQKPPVPPRMIGRGGKTKKLYLAEDVAKDAIKEAAFEIGKLVGYTESQLYSHSLPEELFTILEIFGQSGEVAAEAYLEWRKMQRESGK